MKFLCLPLFLLLTLSSKGQVTTVPIAIDSFQLQSASLQDTFLLHVIPEYIQKRMNEPNDRIFHKMGVILVIIPTTRINRAINYHIRTEYNNYYLLKQWRRLRPLFYCRVDGRYVVVCDE